MIRRAKILEIPEILALTRACATDMISRGIFQWDEDYPSESIFIKDIDLERLYLRVENEEIVGLVALCEDKDPEYETVKWITPDGKNLYVHRLAVHPAHQGSGYARELMDFAEEFARENKYTSIRLDTFSKNPRNQRFYEHRGYTRLEEIFLLNQSPYPFYCYELPL